VQNTIVRFCKATGWEKFRRDRYDSAPGEHRVMDLLCLTAGRSSEDAATELFGNRQRTSPRGGILKAEATLRFCESLVAAGINDFTGLCADTIEEAESRILDIPGQRSGISFEYFMMLAGDDSRIKPDRMVRRFVADALQVPLEKISERRSARLLGLASRDLLRTDENWTPCRLDHAIWLYQRA
jgi:hypothetical protein